MKKFSLVLSGGSARGFAHVGVIKVLNEYGLKPSLIVGTSMGAIVGAMYADGFSMTEIEDKAILLERKDFQDIDLGMLFKDSVLFGNKIRKLLANTFGERDAKDTEIPFIAITSSLDTGKEYALRTGPLYKNVLASASMPPLFPSVKINNINMCDGGLVNNLPEDVAKKEHPKYIILSVDVLADYNSQIDNSKIKIYSKVVNMCSLMQTKYVNEKKNYANLRIRVPQKGIGLFDYSAETNRKSIELGEKAMRKHIDEFIKLLSE